MARALNAPHEPAARVRVEGSQLDTQELHRLAGGNVRRRALVGGGGPGRGGWTVRLSGHGLIVESTWKSAARTPKMAVHEERAKTTDCERSRGRRRGRDAPQRCGRRAGTADRRGPGRRIARGQVLVRGCLRAPGAVERAGRAGGAGAWKGAGVAAARLAGRRPR